MKLQVILLSIFILFTQQHESRGLPPGIPIERIHYQNVTKDEFFKRFVKPPGKPVIIEGAMENWKGFKEWTFDWFTKNYGDVNVDVHSTLQKTHKMLLKDYFNSFKVEKSEKEALYLSNWVYGTDHPELLNYFETPKYFTEDWMKLIRGHPDLRWLYIGPKNTFSLLHIDVLSTSAWLAQFQGKKLWYFFPPSHGEYFGENQDHFYEPKSKKFKRFEVVSKRGDIVFTPFHWWHKVYNLEDSIAMTINYMDGSGFYHTLSEVQESPEVWPNLTKGMEKFITKFPFEEKIKEMKKLWKK